MNQSEAIAVVRAVVRVRTGVDVEPDSIEFKSVGGRRRWTAFYGRRHFIEPRITIGVSGCTVVVNDKTGEVTCIG